MTPLEALQLVDQVAANYQGTRQDHIRLQQALDTLRQLVVQNAPASTRSVATRPKKKQSK